MIDSKQMREFLASMKPEDAAAFLRAANPEAAKEIRKRGQKVYTFPSEPLARAKVLLDIFADEYSRAQRTINGTPLTANSKRPRKGAQEVLRILRDRIREVEKSETRATSLQETIPVDLPRLREYILAFESGHPIPYPTLTTSIETINNRSVADLESEAEDDVENGK